MIITPDNEYTVVLDACVLVPMPICDLLLRLASEPATYKPVWSDTLLEEVRKTMVEKLGRTSAQAQRRISVMREYFPEANIGVPADFMSALAGIPDEDDRHVVAAGIRGKAHEILTYNVRHFPAQILAAYGLAVITPDKFLVNQFHLNPAVVLEKLDAQAAAIRQGRSYVTQLLRERHQAEEFVALVESGVGRA